MITFPASPTIGQQFEIPGKTWEWTGVAWNLMSISDAMILAASNSADDAADSAAAAAVSAASFSGHVEDLGNPHEVTKAQVGLSNVDNTSDAGKPVSTATQTELDLKAPLASPAMTGVPTAPTAASGTSTDQVATTAFVTGEVAALVDSSPATLNTLNELAAALGDDPNFATTTAAAIGLKAPLESPTFTGTVSGVTKAHVGLSNVDNTSDASKPVSAATQTALNLKADAGPVTASGLTTQTARLLGRTTAATGPVEEIAIAGGLTLVAGAIQKKVRVYTSVTRAMDTLYTNATTNEMQVSVLFRFPVIYGAAVVQIDGVNRTNTGQSAFGDATLFMTFAVPPGSTYKFISAGAGTPTVDATHELV